MLTIYDFKLNQIVKELKEGMGAPQFDPSMAGMPPPEVGQGGPPAEGQPPQGPPDPNQQGGDDVNGLLMAAWKQASQGKDPKQLKAALLQFVQDARKDLSGGADQPTQPPPDMNGGGSGPPGGPQGPNAPGMQQNPGQMQGPTL